MNKQWEVYNVDENKVNEISEKFNISKLVARVILHKGLIEDDKINMFLNPTRNDFYDPFIKHFEEVKEIMYKEPLKTTGEKCPVCGGDLVIRKGKHGEFVGCSNYPECTYIKKDESKAPKLVGRDCPNCGSPLVIRKNKSGDEFIGCSNFPIL